MNSVTTPFARTTNDPVLSVRGLESSFGRGARQVRIVRGVGFDLRAARTLVVLGESGSGKSITARSLLRLAPGARVEGQVRLGEDELTTLGDKAMRRMLGRRIGFVPQDPAGALSPLRKVGAQISEVLRYHHMVDGRAAARERAVELIARVGIANPERIAGAHAHELSGGMRQRIAIALAVACDPPIIVADEPTTALDVTVQAQVLDIFAELQERLGMALLLVTHDVGVADRIADEVAVMYAGRIVEHGPVELVLGRPAHPYTRALLRAVPRPGLERGSLARIPGQPPLPTHLPPGCTFAPRCPLAVAACTSAEPPLRTFDGSRRSACLRAEELLAEEAA